MTPHPANDNAPRKEANPQGLHPISEPLGRIMARLAEQRGRLP